MRTFSSEKQFCYLNYVNKTYIEALNKTSVSLRNNILHIQGKKPEFPFIFLRKYILPERKKFKTIVVIVFLGQNEGKKIGSLHFSLIGTYKIYILYLH